MCLVGCGLWVCWGLLVLYKFGVIMLVCRLSCVGRCCNRIASLRGFGWWFFG